MQRCFGYAEVDIEDDYLHQTGRVRGSGKKLLSAEKMLVYEPLLQWYLAHRAEIKAFPRTINYTTAKIFTWFVEQVTAVHRRC